MAKEAPLVIRLEFKGERQLKKTEVRLNKIKDLVNSIDKVGTDLFSKVSIPKTQSAVDQLEKLQKSLAKAAAGSGRWANNFAGLNKQLGKFQTIIKSSKVGTDDFRHALVAAERAQSKLFEARATQSKVLGQAYSSKSNLSKDTMAGLMGFMDSDQFFKSRDALSNYRTELRRVFDSVEIGTENYRLLESQIRKVDGLLNKPQVKKAGEVIGGIRGSGGVSFKGKQLKEAIDLQNKLEAGSNAHVRAILGVRKAQQAYNQELRVSKTIQSALNFDLIVWKKLLDSVPAIVGRIAGGMKGLFTGKFGKLGQATGVVLASKAIQDLIQKIPFLSQALKDNIQQWALLTQRAVEGITGITVAWTGLSGLLGGAQWVVGAVTGFKKFESQAAQSIWNTQRAVKNFYESLSAMAWMMQGKGGSPAGVGQLLKDMALGGEERQESKRYAQQGPTAKELIQKDLDLQITKLKQRNLTEKDYIQILERKFQLERQLRRENRKEKVMEVKAGKPFEEVFSTEIEAADKRRTERLRAYNKEREASIKRGTNLIQDADARIAQAGKDKLKEVQNRWKLEATNHSKELKRIKERQTAEKQRTADRRKAMGRFGENVMLGAGFPMLFGGGPGAVAGGLTGAVGQSLMGSSGFGMQILFSALGQQIDAFVGKTAELGKAFNKINPDVDAVIGSLGEVNTEYGKHLEMLKKIKGDAAAMVEATRRLTEIIGKGGVAAMEKFGDDTTKLGNEWKKMTTLMMASISELINSSGILLTLTQAISKANRFNIFERRVKDIKAGGKSFGDLSQNEKDIMDLAGLRKGILENQGGNKMKQFVRENVAGLTQVLPDGMGGKSMTDFLSRSSGQREALTNIDNQIDTLMSKILAEESIGNLLGSGADKLASIQEEIDLLERSFAIGSKAAGQEQEAAEILEEQNKSRETKLKLNETDILQKIEQRDSLKEQLELWNQIKDTVATGLTNAITGLIEGTKSLGESLGSIAKSIGSMLLQAGISSWIGGMNFGGKAPVKPPTKTYVVAQGGYMANGIKPFASGGLATRPTLGLVGEAGEDEYIIPASKMASSMQRYSAGARGEAVIPSTGSSYAGSGGSSTTVNYSGPILNFNSEEFVPKSAVGQIIATATSQGARAGENRTLSTLRNSRSARSRLGM